MKPKSRITDPLSDLMRLKNVSQTEISTKKNISKATISNYFTHKSVIRSDYLDEILDYLGIDLLRLIKDSIAKSVQGKKKARKGIGEDIAVLLNGLERTPRNNILNTVLKLSARLKGPEELEAKDNIKRFIKD